MLNVVCRRSFHPPLQCTSSPWRPGLTWSLRAQGIHDSLLVTTLFVTAAIVGRPFDLALSLPSVVEEFFPHAGDILQGEMYGQRWMRFAPSVAVAALAFGLAQRIP